MSTKEKKVPVVTYALLEKLAQKESMNEPPRERQGSAPVVTYKLFSYFERKINNKRLGGIRAFEDEDAVLDEAEQKAKKEKLAREFLKKQMHEKFHEFRVIPFEWLQAMKAMKKAEKDAEEKVRNDAFLAELEIDRVKRGYELQKIERAERLKKLRLKMGAEQVIPIGVKQLLKKFEEKKENETEIVECEKLFSPIFATFARTIGFSVIKKESKDNVILTVQKPVSYHSL
jgi:hypothetical protein